MILSEVAWALGYDSDDLEHECLSCGDGISAEGECVFSRRPCGHHCNHIWTHDDCDWCGTGLLDDEDNTEFEFSVAWLVPV